MKKIIILICMVSLIIMSSGCTGNSESSVYSTSGGWYYTEDGLSLTLALVDGVGLLLTDFDNYKYHTSRNEDYVKVGLTGYLKSRSYSVHLQEVSTNKYQVISTHENIATYDNKVKNFDTVETYQGDITINDNYIIFNKDGVSVTMIKVVSGE